MCYFNTHFFTVSCFRLLDMAVVEECVLKWAVFIDCFPNPVDHLQHLYKNTLSLYCISLLT